MAPGVAQVARQYEGKLAVLGVPGRGGADEMRAFVARHGVGFAQAVDRDGSLWKRFGVRYQPAWVFVNGADGQMTVEFGDFEGEALRARFDALIAR